MTPSSECLINGKYRLLKKLGNGAFGSVFLAEQEIFGISLRTVALKVFDTVVRDSIHAREIFNDAVILLRLLEKCKDPSIKSIFINVHDMDTFESSDPAEEEGNTRRGYLAMELMEKDLRSVVGPTDSDKFRKVSITQLMSYMKPVIEGLAFMHAQNPPVLHRDLKPDNILLRYDDGMQIKIGDFGLAVQSMPISGPVRAAGTLNYQDLESFTTGTASPESDVYAIGMIFYELLCGKYPVNFDYSAMAVNDPNARPIFLANLTRMVESPIQRPSRFNVELSDHPWLEEVILNCLSPYRKDRVRNAVELKNLIENRNEVPSGKTLGEKYSALVSAAQIAIDTGPGCYGEAEAALKTAHGMMPRNCRAATLLARLYCLKGDTRKAEELLIERVEKSLECVHLYETLAFLWAQRNHTVMEKRYRERAKSMKACRYM